MNKINNFKEKDINKDKNNSEKNYNKIQEIENKEKSILKENILDLNPKNEKEESKTNE